MTIQKVLYRWGNLSIYEVTGKDEHDQPVYDKDAPFTTWTTRKLEKRHKVIGLIAGHTYILVEDTAPKGWNLMKPVLFTVSSDGRSIQGLSNQMESIEIQRYQRMIMNWIRSIVIPQALSR